MPPARRQPGKYRTLALGGPLVLAISGCGGLAAKHLPNPVNSVFSVTASSRNITTNGQLAMKAVTASGAPAGVRWSVIGGENGPMLGLGAIDERGTYTPPAAITRDSVEVEIEAQLQSDPTKIATQIVEITPSFLQPLTPENSTLAAEASVEVTAQLSEVGGGSVRWQLAASPTGRLLGSAYGSFSRENCRHSPGNYTVCTATYTAPLLLPASGEVYVIATVSAGGKAGGRLPLHILLTGGGVSSTPLVNQSVQNSLVQLGSSGGNNNDADTGDSAASGIIINDCCGGTLGALVRDEHGSQYILSNNHVLAESDQGKIGDTIVQPALIDSNCDQNAARPVAALRYMVPLAAAETNADAALAEVNAGTVDPGGAILQLGAPGAGPNGSIGAAAPAGGVGETLTSETFAPGSSPLLVAKSGRTTGLTCSTIDAIDLSVEVDYYKDCAETRPYYRKTFSGQIGISGDGFSDSGDSGALVVDAANAQPVGLYFAGGSDDRGGGFSVATPIQDVLSELGTQAGHQFSVVGGAEHPVSCLNYNAKGAASPVLLEALRRQAEAAVRKSVQLVNPPLGILELVPGSSSDSPGDPAVIVYIDKNKEGVSVPQTIGGVRTLVVSTDQASLNAGSAPKSNLPSAGLHLRTEVLEAAQEVQRTYASQLLADPAIFGVGVTQSRDNPAEAALLVLVDLSRSPRSMPVIIGGLRTRYLPLNRFHVTRSRHAGAQHFSSCELRSQMRQAAAAEFNPDKPWPLELP